ncbi:MAG: uncharacterized protein A8A55_2941 [Amphiamblys sp. WSBS2006]|nr:MAG: uncharacterized protein A8A55_2941 [Amphiamblys sp. WSBS2006]
MHDFTEKYLRFLYFHSRAADKGGTLARGVDSDPKTQRTPLRPFLPFLCMEPHGRARDWKPICTANTDACLCFGGRLLSSVFAAVRVFWGFTRLESFSPAATWILVRKRFCITFR